MCFHFLLFICLDSIANLTQPNCALVYYSSCGLLLMISIVDVDICFVCLLRQVQCKLVRSLEKEGGGGGQVKRLSEQLSNSEPIHFHR
jgi:hypothetical protein